MVHFDLKYENLNSCHHFWSSTLQFSMEETKGHSESTKEESCRSQRDKRDWDGKSSAVRESVRVRPGVTRRGGASNTPRLAHFRPRMNGTETKSRECDLVSIAQEWERERERAGDWCDQGRYRHRGTDQTFPCQLAHPPLYSYGSATGLPSPACSARTLLNILLRFLACVEVSGDTFGCRID